MCRMQEKTMRCWLIAVAIIMMLTSLTALSAAISAVTNPFMMYARMGYTVLIQGLIVFMILVAGGIVGCIGTIKRKFSCVFAMFWLLVVAEGWAYGLAGNMYGVWYIYSGKDNITTCTEKFERSADLIYVGDTIGANLCTQATCACDLSGVDTTYVTSAGGSTTGTNTKVQQCADHWRSDFDLAGDMMTALEETFKCVGFCSTASSNNENHFSFSNVKNIPLDTKCADHYDKYVTATTGSIGGNFWSVGGSAFFCFIILVILSISQAQYSVMEWRCNK